MLLSKCTIAFIIKFNGRLDVKQNFLRKKLQVVSWREISLWNVDFFTNSNIVWDGKDPTVSSKKNLVLKEMRRFWCKSLRKLAPAKSSFKEIRVNFEMRATMSPIRASFLRESFRTKRSRSPLNLRVRRPSPWCAFSDGLKLPDRADFSAKSRTCTKCLAGAAGKRNARLTNCVFRRCLCLRSECKTAESVKFNPA